MIKVNIYYFKKTIKAIEIKGHSNFATLGKDIVCAGVSSVFQGMLNAISIMFKKNLDCKDVFLQLNIKKGYGLIKLSKPNLIRLNLLLNALYYQLKTISIQYPKYLKINKIT